jgi:hypothetical protein
MGIERPTEQETFAMEFLPKFDEHFSFHPDEIEFSKTLDERAVLNYEGGESIAKKRLKVYLETTK